MTALGDAAKEGLTPSEYSLSLLQDLLASLQHQQQAGSALPVDHLTDLDLLLTDAFLRYSSDLLRGRVSPAVENGAWGAQRETVDCAHLLQAALDADDIAGVLAGLLPSFPAYSRLRQALVRYRALAATGEWPLIPPGAKITKEDHGPRVSQLRARLHKEGDLGPEEAAHDAQFDEAVEQAVRRFQARHGLEVDGVVGPRTRAALNVPAEFRVRQLALNMERWRWLPRNLGARALVVNIAGFTLDVVEREHIPLTMKIVVGKPYTRTPVFQTTVTSVLLNPPWNIPSRIASKELLPLIRRNPRYLAQQHITVLQGWGPRTKIIDPTSVAWSTLSFKAFPYRLRQEPGPWNALGRIKFILPNPFTVYLHDTPAHALFTHAVRAFSHGCIRLEKPLDLAVYVLQGTPWTREALLSAIAQGDERTIRLPEPLPTYVGYWTAWVEENGMVHFRSDLYGRDRKLDRALPPRASEAESFGLLRP
ncbi:MAG: L,D-transpeptidase family protein [Deltaproteobacteria bacterium]|nr:L,D-transpeptidase family protein [Deltaproteobacteria bacterium]